MVKSKVISVSKRGGTGKSTSAYNLGAGLALDGKKVLLLNIDPQGDLTKMLGQRKPQDLPLTLANVINDVASGQVHLATWRSCTTMRVLTLCLEIAACPPWR